MLKQPVNFQLSGIRINGFSCDGAAASTRNVVTGTAVPVFSWKISDGIQHACRIVAASAPERLDSPDVWDSGWCVTKNNLAFPYSGPSLLSCSRVWFRISVELEDGRQAASAISSFSVGLLNNNDWNGKWIYADGYEHHAPAAAPYFRRRFSVRGKVAQALLFGTAKGLLELMLNGQRVDEHDFLPGWTDFNKTIQYVAYDVTSMLSQGENLLGAILGDGWYVTSLPGYRRDLYGSFPSMLIQLELIYEDGRREQIVTDQQWRWSYGPILSSDIYDGENYNAKRLLSGWSSLVFDDSSWKNALELPADEKSPELMCKLMPGVRTDRVLQPVAYHDVTEGVRIYDFGQVITGRIRLRFTALPNADGLRGRISYAEVLNPDGTLYNINFRGADNLDFYVAAEGQNDWESHFTFHGFRYVQLDNFTIEGYQLIDLQIEAIVLTSDLDPTGSFTCGNQPLNQLAANIRNSMKGNLLELPLDCPQRDERLGWSGDAHIFFPTAMFLADGRYFYRKYLKDLRDTQREDGAICSVAPVVPGFQFGSPGFADALPIITWELYRRSGDLAILRENYEAVKRYVNFEHSQSRGLILKGHVDHLSLAEKPADPCLIGTAFFKRSAGIAAKMADLLGHPEDAKEYRDLEERILAALHREFLTAEGILKEPSQTGFALLFYFDLLTDSRQKELNAQVFEKLIRENNYHLDTGFIGTAYLCPSLAKAGLAECACNLVLQHDYPSWLFEVDNGATTIWERWNSWHPEKGFATPWMNSFNHYANGAVGEYLFAYLAGLSFLATDDSGKLSPQIRFSIIPDSRIGHASAQCETPCGLAQSEWILDGDCVRWHCIVPPNTIGSLQEYGIEHLAPGEHEYVFKSSQAENGWAVVSEASSSNLMNPNNTYILSYFKEPTNQKGTGK